MHKKVSTFLSLSLIFAIAFSQTGCDKLFDFFKNFSDLPKKEALQPATPSYEKTQLLDILANQQELIEEMKNARASGDRDSFKESYERILRSDQGYQQEYEKYESKLSPGDLMEISKKHRQIIESIPR